MSGKRIIEGLTEAVAIAKGERPAARIHVNGHAYIPEALEFRPPIPEPVWAEMVERGKQALIARDAMCSQGRCSYPPGCMCEADASACLRAALGLERGAADDTWPKTFLWRGEPVSEEEFNARTRAAADAVHEPEER